MKHIFKCSLVLLLALTWIVPDALAQTVSDPVLIKEIPHISTVTDASLNKELNQPVIGSFGGYHQFAIVGSNAVMLPVQNKKRAYVNGSYTSSVGNRTNLWVVNSSTIKKVKSLNQKFYGNDGNYATANDNRIDRWRLAGPGIASDESGNVYYYAHLSDAGMVPSTNITSNYATHDHYSRIKAIHCNTELKTSTLLSELTTTNTTVIPITKGSVNPGGDPSKYLMPDNELAHFMSVSGTPMTATGGCVWVATAKKVAKAVYATDGSKISDYDFTELGGVYRINIVSGKVTGVDKFNYPDELKTGTDASGNPIWTNDTETPSNGTETGSTDAPNQANCMHYVKQYAPGKLMLHIHKRANSGKKNKNIYRGTIGVDVATGKEKITWEQLDIKAEGSQATMFMLDGEEIVAYSSNLNTVTVKNLTKNAVLAALQVNYTDKSDGDTNTANGGNVWTRHALQAKKISDRNVDLYVYVGSEATGNAADKGKLVKYSITAKGGYVDLKVALNTEDGSSSQPGRQDYVLTWNAPTTGTGTVKNYTVSYRTIEQTEVGGNASWDGVKWSAFKDTVTINAGDPLTWTHKDVKWKLKNDVAYMKKYQYRVVANYTDGGTGDNNNSAELMPKLIPNVATWIGDSPVNFDGYCKVQLLWNVSESYGLKPSYFKVMRNEEVLMTLDKDGKPTTTPMHVQQFVYIDETVKAKQTYKYKIVSCFGNYTKDDGYSESQSVGSNAVTIAARDWAKPSYRLEQVYDYPISDYVENETSTTEVMGEGTYPNFTYRDCYRQGVYYRAPGAKDGHWLIAQLSDKSPVNWTYDASAKGGVVAVNANDPTNKNKRGRTLYWSGPKRSAGIAVDEGGNIFVNFKTAGYDDTNNKINSTITENEFSGIIHTGKVFLKKGIDSQGFPSYGKDADGIAVDLTNIGGKTLGGTAATINYCEYFHPKDGDTRASINPGRSDYYTLSGNLSANATGNNNAYLYLAPTLTRGVYVLQLKRNGNAIECVRKVAYHDEYYKSHNNDPQYLNSATQQPYGFGHENYAFPVRCAGRTQEISGTGTYYNEFIHTVRSNVLSAHKIGDLQVSKESTRIGTVYDTQSRVNQAGGCTLEFNGELFVITPQNHYSCNTGSFYVGMGERLRVNNADGSTRVQTAAEANLTRIIPAAEWIHPDDASATGANSSGVWIAAEVPDISLEPEADENKDGKADYAYIYTYVPGTRFAKYKLIPSSAFPPSPVEITVSPVYEDNRNYEEELGENVVNPGGDIKRFDATTTWNHVYGYGMGTEGNNFYEIAGYTLDVVDAAGKHLFTTLKIEVDPTTGKPLSLFSGVDDDGNPIMPVATLNFSSGVAGATSVNSYTFPTESTYTFDFYNTKTKETVKITVTDNPYPGYTFSVEDGTDADGNTVPFYTFVAPDVVKNEDYTAIVNVNYAGLEGNAANGRFESEKSEDTDIDTYTPKAPSGNVAIHETIQWEDWNENKLGSDYNNMDPNDGYYKNYHIVLDVKNPEFDKSLGEEAEPRTNYTLSVSTDGIADKVQNDFYLYDPIVDGKNITGLTPDDNGYVHITNGIIPGDYNFDNDVEGKPNIYWNVKDYIGYGTDGTLDPKLETDPVTDPKTWKFVVTANYAANNAKIATAMPATLATVSPELIPTGTEEIDAVKVLNAYPVPTRGELNIVAPQAIKHVEVYSMAGIVVMSVAGNDEPAMKLDISELAEGHYFLRVNNFAPLRIVKN